MDGSSLMRAGAFLAVVGALGLARADDPPPAGAEALGPPLRGARGALLGEEPGGAPEPPLTMVLAGRGGGMLCSPRGTEWFRDVSEALRDSSGDMEAALAPLLWPQGSAPARGTVRVFVPGLNTPRADGRDPGEDTRLRRYLEQGYLSAPLVALHNATALEGPGEGPARPPDRVTIDLPLGPDSLTSLREAAVDRLLPMRRRDFYRAARLRLTGFGATPGGYVTGEIAGMARLAEAVLGPQGSGRLHVVGYSDGSLIVEHGIKLAAARLAERLRAGGLSPAEADVQVERLLRARLFLEYWGNATPPLVPGPRRLLIHDTEDFVTGQSLPGVPRFGVLTGADVPAAFRDDTVLVSFVSPWSGPEQHDKHNALTAIGPALRAMERLELGLTAVPPGPVGFDEAPSLRLWSAIKGRGLVERAYSPEELGVDWERYRPWLWRT